METAPICEDSRLAAGSLFTFLLGFILDTVTTVSLVAHPHIREMNPLIRAAMDAGGAFGIVGVKLGFVLGFCLFIILVYPAERRRLWFLVTGFTIGLLWGGAGIWNLHLLL